MAQVSPSLATAMDDLDKQMKSYFAFNLNDSDQVVRYNSHFRMCMRGVQTDVEVGNLSNDAALKQVKTVLNALNEQGMLDSYTGMSGGNGDMAMGNLSDRNNLIAACSEIIDNISAFAKGIYKDTYPNAEKLQKAMGPNAIIFGIRHLDVAIVGDQIYDSNLLRNNNVAIEHENVFFTNSSGRLYNIGFFSDAGLRSDNALVGANNKAEYLAYHFSRVHPMHQPLSQEMFEDIPGFEKNDYKLRSHNCQDYADAVRCKFGIPVVGVDVGLSLPLAFGNTLKLNVVTRGNI